MLLQYCFELMRMEEYRKGQCCYACATKTTWRWRMHPAFVRQIRVEATPQLQAIRSVPEGAWLWGWPIVATTDVLAVRFEPCGKAEVELGYAATNDTPMASE